MWREIIRPYGEAILFAVLITTFLFTLTGVEGHSMTPSLRTGERMFIPKYETWLHRMGIGSFQRGDILVFKPPVEAGDRVSFFGLWDYNPTLVKRLIGLPGDRIRIEQGEVFVNGEKIDQSFTTDFWQKQGCWDTGSVLANYARSDLRSGQPLEQEYTVPQGHYFVMGDNRTASGSTDSRLLGAIPIQNVFGRATAIVWPVVRKVDETYDCASGQPQLSGDWALNLRVLHSPFAR
nr:signal peptidase I [Deinobacterium chartae]